MMLSMMPIDIRWFFEGLGLVFAGQKRKIPSNNILQARQLMFTKKRFAFL